MKANGIPVSFSHFPYCNKKVLHPYLQNLVPGALDWQRPGTGSPTSPLAPIRPLPGQEHVIIHLHAAPPPRTPSTHTAGELRVQNGARRGTRRPVRLPPWGLSQSPWHGTLWNLRQGLPVSDQRFISGGCPQGESQTRKPTLKLPPPSCPLWGHQS